MRILRFPRRRLRALASRRKLGAVAAAVLAVIFVVAACDPAPNGKVDQLTIVGSDTTQEVMGQIANLYNIATSYNTDHDVLQNILALQTTAKTVPADANCGQITWHTPAGSGELLAPNGSTAGRDSLSFFVQAGNGCVDAARSSAGPRPVGTAAGQDLPSFQYFAYALDAVGIASISSHVPAGGLTLAQVQGIYNCTFTDWSQVGGTAGPIQRYWPQAGSGTRAFAQSDLLGGFDPTTVSTASCPPVILNEENNPGLAIVANGDQQTGIAPLSGAQFVAQSNGTDPNTLEGIRELNINGQNIIAGSGASAHLNTAPGPVQESNVRLVNPTPAYPGIRYVFNVLDSTSKAYSQIAYFLGFGTDSGSKFKSPLCNNQFASVLTQYGFAPLSTAVDSVHNPAGSTCRLWKPS
ncbi:MAG: hypothetical protein J2P17_09390 [Mycobacterium sp.]|nr:hypothetical protein [Mycobacterium sp.]